MHANVNLPKAFSIRDEHELPMIQHLLTRLNPTIVANLVATGMHVSGGATVHWGIVYQLGQDLTKSDVWAALEEAGFDFEHNAEVTSAIWTNS
jgi:hypothetical protein